jgi:hypothetical protein
MFADLALASRICPKTPGRHSPRRRRQIRDHAVKDPAFFAVQDKAQPSTIIYQLPIAENWLDPEPGRTPAPRMGPVRLSRDSQNRRFDQFVNENLQVFFLQRLTTDLHELFADCTG